MKSSDLPEMDSGIISVQLLEFKTSLLEAAEELHIHRVWSISPVHLF